ncbi:Outer envelope protein 61-like protein [Drosera capensis]
MFNGTMDPEMIRIAQEQISRMSPDELARIQQQMMSNPDLLKMASESVKNLSTEDLKFAAEQFKHTRPEEMAEISEKMANASPEELAAMRAHADAQMAYEISGAEILKKQGNQFHSQGKYRDASEKYLLAKNNLKLVPSAKAKTISLACSLNLMSCYLKTRQYDECIKEGSEVLASDSKNVKALYRRGQAYKELGKFEVAVADLSKAHEISPDDDTISEVLRDAKESLEKQGGARTVTSSGLVIEEITEEDESSPLNDTKTTTEGSVSDPPKNDGSSKVNDKAVTDLPLTKTDCLKALQDDPNTIKSFQNFISNADLETLAKVGGVSGVDNLPPEMLKTATNMISKMSPDDLQNMIKLASSLELDKPSSNGTPLRSDIGPGLAPPNMTPEKMKAASDMMSKMPLDELQKMFEMASSLKHGGSVSSVAASSSRGNGSDSVLKSSMAQENTADERSTVTGVSSSSGSSYLNSGSNFASTSTADLQEQMRNQMKDPAMKQMFASMMKNLSPDMMASMGEQFGVKLSHEDAEKAQQAMASMSPEDLDRMMRWADRVQRGVEGMKKTKNWLLGKPGMILAICMLILAIILHRLGFIGS